MEDTRIKVDELKHQDDWVWDSQRSRCYVCKRNFGTFRRRHHCRKCGEVVCSNCTIFRMVESVVGQDARVRICLSCMSSTEQSRDIEPVAIPEEPSSTNLPVNDETWQQKPIVYQEMNYQLDFDWDHAWPKPPLIPEEEERLEALYSYDILDSPSEDVYAALCDLMKSSLKCPIAAISFMDKDRQWFKATVGLAQDEIPRNVSFCAHTMKIGTSLVVANTLQDKRFAKNPLVTGVAHIRFYAAAPIWGLSGHIMGTVFVMDKKPRTMLDIAVLEKIASVCMRNIELRRSSASI